MDRRIRVLGIDSGFASIGVSSVMTVPDLPTRIVQAEVSLCTTKKADKKTNLYASEDIVQRAGSITDFMVPFFEWADLVAIESLSYPRNAANSAKIGVCWGVISALIRLHSVPVVQFSPQIIKKALCGKITASKTEIEEAVVKRLEKDEVKNPLLTIPSSQREHVADATAIAICALKTDLFRVLAKGRQ